MPAPPTQPLFPSLVIGCLHNQMKTRSSHGIGAVFPLLCAVPFASCRADDKKLAPFDASRASLERYRTPDWFRDAKFGIWSHWGPQAVPRRGDWYARRMYIPGDAAYEDHIKRYGHPSRSGYKDIVPLWKAEKWDPDALMKQYVRAGAKYFVSMGVHHDNFDLWNSRYHSWNSVNMGPRRDVVGTWQRAARKHGLRFGVSEHLGASYTWLQVSHGADKTGPLAGVPYDGADPKFQQMYHAPDESQGSGGPWYSNNRDAQLDWQRRIGDLIDSYQPDFLYCDGGIPFGDIGRGMIAHLYNSSIAHHDGRLEAVYTHKDLGSGEFIPGAGVQDVERGVLPGINARPWQTDTSIGDWFYSDNYRYKTADEVIHSLEDIVSKNGNLLVNVVQYADGSLPPESQQFLREMAGWMPINGEAIYGTRPWTIAGEGPTQIRGGAFRENIPFTARDIRFTTKKGTLYAMTLGVPTGQVLIRALAFDSPLVTKQISKIELLGFKGTLNWARTDKGLTIQVPDNLAAKHSLAFKLSGLRTVSTLAPEVVSRFSTRINEVQEIIVSPNRRGEFVLNADDAKLHGALQVEGAGGARNIGFWNSGQDFASWQLRAEAPGTYRVSVEAASEREPTDYIVEVGDQKLSGQSVNTGSWQKYQTSVVGQITVVAPGPRTLVIRPANPANWRAMNVRRIQLEKVDGGG